MMKEKSHHLLSTKDCHEGIFVGVAPSQYFRVRLVLVRVRFYRCIPLQRGLVSLHCHAMKRDFVGMSIWEPILIEPHLPRVTVS